MKNIAIISSGNIGGNLGRLFASKHNVTLGSRNPEQTRAKLPGLTVTDYTQAANSADIVFLAGPFSEVTAIAAKIGSFAGKTLIDVTNPLTADFMALTTGHTTSAGEAVQAAFPQAHVVKASNTVLAQVLAKAASGAKSLPSVLVAGNHAAAAFANLFMEIVRADPVAKFFGRRDHERAVEQSRLLQETARTLESGDQSFNALARLRSFGARPIKIRGAFIGGHSQDSLE